MAAGSRFPRPARREAAGDRALLRRWEWGDAPPQDPVSGGRKSDAASERGARLGGAASRLPARGGLERHRQLEVLAVDAVAVREEARLQIGRASCRERVESAVVA